MLKSDNPIDSYSSLHILGFTGYLQVEFRSLLGI